MTFRLVNTSLNTGSYSSLFMLYDLSDEIGNVVCWGSGILSMWDVGDVGCLGCGDVGCWGFGMFSM